MVGTDAPSIDLQALGRQELLSQASSSEDGIGYISGVLMRILLSCRKWSGDFQVAHRLASQALDSGSFHELRLTCRTCGRRGWSSRQSRSHRLSDCEFIMNGISNSHRSSGVSANWDSRQATSSRLLSGVRGDSPGIADSQMSSAPMQLSSQAGSRTLANVAGE